MHMCKFAEELMHRFNLARSAKSRTDSATCSLGCSRHLPPAPQAQTSSAKRCAETYLASRAKRGEALYSFNLNKLKEVAAGCRVSADARSERSERLGCDATQLRATHAKRVFCRDKLSEPSVARRSVTLIPVRVWPCQARPSPELTL